MANLVYAINQGPLGVSGSVGANSLTVSFNYWIFDDSTAEIVDGAFGGSPTSISISVTLTSPGPTESDYLNAITAAIRTHESDNTLTVTLLK